MLEADSRRLPGCARSAADDRRKKPRRPNSSASTKQLLARLEPAVHFQDFDENTRATTFYTTGTTGNPKGVYFTHRQLVLHTMGVSTSWAHRTRAGFRAQRRVHADHPDVPRARLGLCRMWRPCSGSSRSIPVAMPEYLVELWRKEKVTFSHCVPTILQMVLNAKAAQGTISAAGKSSSAAVRSTGACTSAGAKGHPVYRRLRHVGNRAAGVVRAPQR